MNIDDLKSSYQSLSFKENKNENIDFTRKVESIVEKVKQQDRRDKMILVIVSILFIFLAISYTIMGIVDYLKNPDGTMWWGYGLYALAILTALPVFRLKYKKIGASNYQAPVAQFINDVEKKFAFFPKEYHIRIIPFLLLFDASIIYIFAENGKPTIQSSLMAQIPIIVGLVIGVVIGAIIWYTKKLPILKELRAIKSNII